MRRKRQYDKEPDKQNQKPAYVGTKLGTSLDENIQLFKQIFTNDETLTVRFFENQQEPLIKCCALFIDGMIDAKMVDENIIRPIMQNTELSSTDDVISRIDAQVVFLNKTQRTQDIDMLSIAIVDGKTVLLIEGSQDGLILSTKGFATRPISEPQSERVNRGPREGFIEPIMENLTMIRRKVKTPALKMKLLRMGVQTNTCICICYIEGIAKQKILDELYRRLDRLNPDGILDIGYIKEMIRDCPFSPFKTIGDSERPDTVAGKLLDGYIAILVDGSPVVALVPFLFRESFQITEDYSSNFYFASISRLLRILSFFISISVPAIYLALVTYHYETLPTPLLMSISAARQGVPFPTIIEISIFLIVFEILREAGVRMPYYIGQALSIVGAMVLGTAAVDARLVSAPIVIVVSLTAITGLSLPGTKGAVIILRIIFLFLASFLGLYGLIFGAMGMLLHLCELRSFGVPYMLSFTKLEMGDLRDTAIRAPWWMLSFRSRLLSNNRLRQKIGGRRR